MRYEDERFARDPRFRFFALNSKLRWKAITLGNVFVRQERRWLDGWNVCK